MDKMVQLIETEVKPWVDSRLDDQRKRVRKRFDAFELRLTH